MSRRGPSRSASRATSASPSGPNGSSCSAWRCCSATSRPACGCWRPAPRSRSCSVSSPSGSSRRASGRTSAASVTDDAAGRRWLAAWRVCRSLPEPAARALGWLGGRAFYRLDARRRDALRANLRHVLGPAVPPARLERAVRRNFAMYGRYWVEAFRLEDLGPAEIRGRLRLDGGEHLEAAAAAGRGVLFA